MINKIEEICSKIGATFKGWEQPIYYGRIMTNIELKCDIHGNIKSLTLSELLKDRSGFRCCSDRGFQENKPSVLYVTKWQSYTDHFYKYGITKNYPMRERNQKCKTGYIPTNILKINFISGKYAANLERELKDFCSTRNIDKIKFKDGYTETFLEDKLNGVLDIVSIYKRRFEYAIV